MSHYLEKYLLYLQYTSCSKSKLAVPRETNLFVILLPAASIGTETASIGTEV
jgi:hypothetical protein